MTVKSHYDVVLSAYFGEKNGSPRADRSWAPPRVSATPCTRVLKGTEINHGLWAPEIRQGGVNKQIHDYVVKQNGKKDENRAELST